MADWDEVKRLAADFQKVQLTSTAQRLSERNCIEIVTWLINRKYVDLIFTTDGKEYLTPAQLIQDIRGELYVNGGRVNYVELAKSIGVDLSHITTHVGEVLKGHRDIHSVLGQLIDTSYINKIAGEINEKLQQQGQINVNDLTVQYDLPAEFIQTHLLERQLGKLIFGRQDKNDPKLFFTESFIARCKAKIRGALMGVSKPTPISIILSNMDITEKLFFNLFDQTTSFGTLTSRMAGAQYIPNIYAKSQNEWVNSFYKQNGYLEFDALSRIGITDYKNYLKRQLPNETLHFLNSCLISQRVLDRAEADIDECVISRSHLDLQSNLPSIFTVEDIRMTLDLILTGQKQKDTILIDDYIFSKAFLDSLANQCENLVQENAKQIVNSGKYQQYQMDLQVATRVTQKQEDVHDEKPVFDKREERRKKATGGKSGGGTQGRETKTKSTKKHRGKNFGGGDDDSDEFNVLEKKRVALEVVTFDDVKKIILQQLEDEGLDHLLDSLITYLLPALNLKGLALATNLYATTIVDKTTNRRQTHNEIQNKLNALLTDVRLFEKGARMFPSDVQSQLYKYLLKTLCTDVANETINYVSAEVGLNTTVNSNNTNEQKLKFVNELPIEYRTSLQATLKSLTGQSIEDFMKASEESLTACSMILKKIDKKKDRVVVLNHKHTLLEQLNKCDDPATVLHLTALIVFVTATQNMLYASGRHVNAILTFLKDYLNVEQSRELTDYHDLVILMLSNGSETENAREKLLEKMSTIKTMANEYKKVSGNSGSAADKS